MDKSDEDDYVSEEEEVTLSEFQDKYELLYSKWIELERSRKMLKCRSRL